MDGLKVKVNVYDIIDIYEKEISRNTKNKRKINNFERNKMENIYDIINILENKNYIPSRYNIFSINSPKYRIVMSLNIKDKIINHYLTRKILIKKLDKYLDIRNCATRKNMGYDYAVKLLLKYLNKYKYDNTFYILKLDISKYFYSIDHDVLKSLLKDKLDSEEYEIICNVIDSTNDYYVNDRIRKLKEELILKDGKRKEEIEKIPLYEYKRGLSIGNMTSQILSIFYLYELDHYIVNNLKLKCMVRYMDDYVILCKDREYLKNCLLDIKDLLENKYKLKLNDNKSFIVSSREGFDFLGYRYRIVNNKIIINVKKSNKIRLLNNINRVNYLYRKGYISYNKYFSSINNYKNVYKYIDITTV